MKHCIFAFTLYHPYLVCVLFGVPSYIFLMYIWVHLMYIGTCRAVWIPGQDLAMPHLMRNSGKCTLSLHCTPYVRLCVRKHAYVI